MPLLELRPLGGEFVPHGKKARRTECLGHLDSRLHVLHRSVTQQPAARPCRVADVQNNVADRVIVELQRFFLRRIGGKIDLPFADGAGVLEGQVPLVAEIRLEKPRIVLR